MPEEQVKRKRGRPPKNKTTTLSSESQLSETNQDNLKDKEYEFNSYSSFNQLFDSIFNCGIYNYFTK